MPSSAMKLLFLSLALCVALCQGQPRVTIKQGVLEGSIMTSRKNREFLAFRGIPYAKPPTGDRRFKSPEPPARWSGVLNATRDGPLCIQKDLLMRKPVMVGQEDCLVINVFTHKLKGPLRPVMVWIHGGAWFAGGTLLSILGPGFFMDEDIVLVTFNYRLAAMGFLSTEDSSMPGNYGMKDQVLALRWVQENIAAFGGDRGAVTIAGQSAGAASVHYLMVSPMAKGLFHRAVSQSGTALDIWAFPIPARSTAFKLGAAVGCRRNASEELLACLRTVDATAIVEAHQEVFEWHLDPLLPFRPVIEPEDSEDPFLPDCPLRLLQSGRFHKVPWMLGITSQEGAIRAALFEQRRLFPELNRDFDHLGPLTLHYHRSARNATDVTRKVKEFYYGDQPITVDNAHVIVEMFTDRMFLLGADKSAKLHSAVSDEPVYFYVFSYKGPFTMSMLYGNPTRNYGACHSDDRLYQFKNSWSPPFQRAEYKMVDVMISLWTNFVKTGNPTPEKSALIPTTWRPFTEADRRYFGIGSELLRKKNHRQSRVSFWKSLSLDDYRALRPPATKEVKVDVVLDSLLYVYKFFLKRLTTYSD